MRGGRVGRAQPIMLGHSCLMTTLCTYCPLESYSQGVADLDQGIDCGIRALGESILFKHDNGISDRSHEYT